MKVVGDTAYLNSEDITEGLLQGTAILIPDGCRRIGIDSLAMLELNRDLGFDDHGYMDNDVDDTEG